MTVSWQSPATNKLLLDARLATHGEELYNSVWNDDPNSVWRSLIAVTEQGGPIPGLLYRGAGQAAGPTFIFAAMSAPNIWELPRIGHLRDRRARPQVRRRQQLGPPVPARARHPFGHQLPLQQRRAEPDHHARLAGEPLRRPEGRARPLRPGQVDDRPADAERRPALRLLQHLLPRDAARPGPAGAHPQLRGAAVRLVQLEGPLAARRGGVRPVRHRQDRAQGQHRPLRRWPATTRSATCSRFWPTPSRGRGTTGAAWASTATTCRSATCSTIRPTASAASISDLRFGTPGPQHGLRPRGAGGLGQARLQLGVLGRRAARADRPRRPRRRLLPPHLRQLHGDRQPRRDGRPTTAPSRSSRPSTRVCPTAAATR